MRRALLRNQTRLALVISIIALICVCSPAFLKVLRQGIALAGDKVWENDELIKRQQPRFHVSEDTRRLIPHWVISLPRAAERREGLQLSFQRENVTFEFVDGFDARARLPVQQASRYLDEHILQQATLRQLPIAHRGRIAASLSHLALMERAVADDHPVVVQFEGDAMPLPGFQKELDYALEQLPSDWDVLYLTGCRSDELYSPLNSVSGYVGEGIRNLRWGFVTCPTWAFVYRNSTAQKVTAYVESKKLSVAFDVLLGRLAFSGSINSYTTDHWLVTPGVGSEVSLLNHFK